MPPPEIRPVCAAREATRFIDCAYKLTITDRVSCIAQNVLFFSFVFWSVVLLSRWDSAVRDINGAPPSPPKKDEFQSLGNKTTLVL